MSETALKDNDDRSPDSQREKIIDYLSDFGLAGGNEFMPNQMAGFISEIPLIEIPDGFSVQVLDPSDKTLARIYNEIQAKSLGASHVPYSNDRYDESLNAYFVGKLNEDDLDGPVCTLRATNFSGQGKVLVLNDVSTVPEKRRLGLSAAMISDVVHKHFQDFDAVLLSSTDEGVSLYESLGLVTISS